MRSSYGLSGCPAGLGRLLILLFSLSLAAGCGDTTQTVTAGILGLTYLGGQSPNNEIEQVYYIGSIDPQGQVPPQMYRIRLHGQASFYSNTKFASGWVPAAVIDSLSNKSLAAKSGISTCAEGDTGCAPEAIESLRRLVQFGPDGFRYAPENHRLVVVMGADPSAFFSSVDQALGTIGAAQASQRSSALTGRIFEILVTLKNEQARLAELELAVVRELK